MAIDKKFIECKHCGATLNLSSCPNVKKIKCPFCRHITIIIVPSNPSAGRNDGAAPDLDNTWNSFKKTLNKAGAHAA